MTIQNLKVTFRDFEGNNNVVVFYFKTSSEYIYRNFIMANSHFKCGEFEFTKTKIVMPCLSKLDTMLHLCETDFRNDDMSLCKVYKFDIYIDPSIPLDYLGLRIQYYEFLNEDSIFFVNFFIQNKNFNLMNLEGTTTKIFQQFFFIKEGFISSYTLPIEGLFIDRLFMIANNTQEKHRKILISSKDGYNYNLIVFSMKRGVVDLDSLKEGFLHSGVEHLTVDDHRIIILDILPTSNILEITIYDLEKMTNKTLLIDKQKTVLSSDSKDMLLYLQTRNTRFISEFYIVNMLNGRIYKSDYFKYQENQSLILFSMENRYFIHRLNYSGQNNLDMEIEMEIVALKDKDRILFMYDLDSEDSFLKNRDPDKKQFLKKFEIIDNFGQAITTTQLVLFNKKIPIMKYNFAFVDSNHIYYSPKSPLIQGRTFEGFSYYIKLMGNNLDSNMADPSILWLNALNFRFQVEAFDSLLKCDSMYMFASKKMFILCKNNYVIHKKISYTPSTDPKKVKTMNMSLFRKQVYRSNDKHSDFEYMEYYDQFILILKKNTQLFYFNYHELRDGKTVAIINIQLPRGSRCHFKSNLLWCYKSKYEKISTLELSKKEKDQNSIYKGSQYFDFIQKTGIIYARELLIFIPNMANLIHGRTFLFSFFTPNTFFTLTNKSGHVYLVTSDDKGYVDKKRIRLFTEDMFVHMNFYEISDDVFLFIYSHDLDLKVWVYSNQSIYNYPCMDYMKEFKKLILIRIMKRASTFAILYIDTSDKTRCIVMAYSTNPMNRIVKDFQIYPKICPEENTFLDMFFRFNVINLLFYCGTTRTVHAYMGYMFYGVSLQINRDQEFYQLKINQLHNDYTFKETEYYQNVHVYKQNIIFKEIFNSKELIGLETQGYLKLKGDVLKIRMMTESPYIKFFKRVRLVDSINYKHIHKLSREMGLSINSTEDGHVRVITNELIITDYDKQFNNLYADCKYTYYDSHDFIIKNLNNIYTCKSKVGSFFIFTDFYDFKIQIPTRISRLDQPSLILVRDYVFICFKTMGQNSITVMKYMIEENNLNHISYISKVVISNNLNSPSMVHLSKVFTLYHSESNILYILFDRMHSKAFEIQGFRVIEDFVSTEDHYRVSPEDKFNHYNYLK